ncbi:M23 family metallopeptidase [Persicirhabdus sediminis]|uniref:murein hydrolase activator EnvC family protein n=1 Tax=Persicirhabdus sediminis TaxID=454144 RepID=UPI002D7F81E5|nr:M23 family metallopeptidase [Persicirhabdus sediminis]
MKPLILLVGLFLSLFSPLVSAEEIKVRLADGFDFPVGKPDATGYYKARGLRLRAPSHFGEDWNGRGGGDSDLGDPVYSIADGVVTFAHDLRRGWGKVAIIRYGYRDKDSGEVKFIDALYGHLRDMSVKNGQVVKRGEKIGTIGNNRGMYSAHLHFEMRHNLTIGMHRSSVPATIANWADPTQFIYEHRVLPREWRKYPMPIGTYRDYGVFKGL